MCYSAEMTDFSTQFVVSQLPSNNRAALRPLLQVCWAETYKAELADTDVAEMIATLNSDDVGGLAPNSDETIFIATQDGHIRGCAISAARYGITYLWGCYVVKGSQRNGIGRRLVRRAVSVHELTNMVQISVLKSSCGATEFYQSLGFKTLSEEQFELLPGCLFPSTTMALWASELD